MTLTRSVPSRWCTRVAMSVCVRDGRFFVVVEFVSLVDMYVQLFLRLYVYCVYLSPSVLLFGARGPQTNVLVEPQAHPRSA